MVIIVIFAVAAFFLVLFLVGVLLDRRRMSNSIYLFLGLAVACLGLLGSIGSADHAAGAIAFDAVAVALLAGMVFLTLFLLWDGVTMLRREGRSPANLLSLLAGLGLIVYAVAGVLAVQARVGWLELALQAILHPLSYVVFLFICFLLYALVYGRIPHRGTPDFVIALGSGLIGGDRVPPLLASRLNRARAAVDAAAARDRYPVLITSGGQGPGETIPEGRAMADYLIARGFPAERIAVEDESRTTEENLRFSARIMDDLKPGRSRCLVVTNNFHVMRAAHLTRRLKLNAQVIGSRTALYYWPSAFIREFVAVFLSYRITNTVICGLLFLSTLREL